MDISLLGRHDDLLNGNVPRVVPVRYVLSDGAVEQNRLLWYDAEVVAKRRQPHVRFCIVVVQKLELK